MWALLDFYIQQTLTSNCSDIIMLIKKSGSPIPTLPYLSIDLRKVYYAHFNAHKPPNNVHARNKMLT